MVRVSPAQLPEYLQRLQFGEAWAMQLVVRANEVEEARTLGRIEDEEVHRLVAHT